MAGGRLSCLPSVMQSDQMMRRQKMTRSPLMETKRKMRDMDRGEREVKKVKRERTVRKV